MRTRERIQLFEQALSQIKAGQQPEQVLSLLPEDKELVEMVRLASGLQLSAMPASAGAQARSKQSMLRAAQSTQGGSRGGIFGSWLRAPQFALVLVLVIASLSFSGLVSAQALPGQPFYSIKRSMENVQLALTRDSTGRLQLEEVLDARRVNEVVRLRSSGQMASVQFAGWLQQDPTGDWSVQGIPLVLDEGSPYWNVLLNGAYVQITGQVSQAGVRVETIELRLFEINGLLEKTASDQWQINGIPVEISANTQLFTPIDVGMEVRASAIRLSTEQYLLLSIRQAPGSEPAPQDPAAQSRTAPGLTNLTATIALMQPALSLTETVIPSLTSTPTAGTTQDVDDDEERQVEDSTPTEQSSQSDPTSEVSETDEPDDDEDEQERPTKTPEADD